MSPMGNGTLRNIYALVARDLGDAVRNPTTLMSCGAGVLLAVVIGNAAANASRLDPGEAGAFALIGAFCIGPAFAGSVVELFVMAEERERGVYVTLAGAGVTAGELAVSKWLSATLVTLAVQVAVCLLLGFAPSEAAALLALTAVAAQPLLLAGLACGLFAREQMASSLLAVPLTVVAVAPIVAFMSEAVRPATWFWPLGPAAEMLRAMGGMEAMAPAPVLAALAAAWVAAAAALAVHACRRFARDLAAERNRLR